MKYLDCIELLTLALQVLKDGQRDQVALSKLVEVQTLVTRLQSRVTDLPIVTMQCTDVLGAITIVQSNKYMQYLSQTMRDTLLQTLRSAMTNICDAAWDYYMVNPVELTAETMPLYRTIVSYHYNRGD